MLQFICCQRSGPWNCLCDKLAFLFFEYGKLQCIRMEPENWILFIRLFFSWMGIGNLRRSSRWRDGAKLMGGSSRKASFLPRMGLKKLAHYPKGMGTGGVIQFAYVIVFVILEPGWRTWYPFTKSWKEKAQILSRNRTLFLSHCYAHDKNELFCKSAIFLLNYLSLDFHF